MGQLTERFFGNGITVKTLPFGTFILKSIGYLIESNFSFYLQYKSCIELTELKKTVWLVHSLCEEH